MTFNLVLVSKEKNICNRLINKEMGKEMWICERKAVGATPAGLDLGRIKDDVNLLLADSVIEIGNKRFTFLKKGVTVECGGESKLLSVYATNHRTTFSENDAEVFIGIVTKEMKNGALKLNAITASTPEYYEMDLALKKALREIDGDFAERVKQIEKILDKCKSGTRLFLFYIEKECCIEEQKKDSKIWRKSTNRYYNMKNVINNYKKLKGTEYFKILYLGETDATN